MNCNYWKLLFNAISNTQCAIDILKGVKGEMGEPGLTGPHGFNGRLGLRGGKGEEGDAGLGNAYTTAILFNPF